ncbi:MAG: DUF4330 domain-containing protein [Clostridia bacterium]|nr:DUF4330 domain-containing protein [Clostridia bacterium]
MTRKKLSFNLVDVLILLVIAAAAFLVLYVFVLSGRGGVAESASDPVGIRYVVEIVNLDDRFAGSVKEGQAVFDGVTQKKIGEVDDVEIVPYEKIVFDYDNAKERVSEAEGRQTMRITVTADAVETDRAFTVNGTVIRVGTQYSLMLPDFYGVGFCILLEPVS